MSDKELRAEAMRRMRMMNDEDKQELMREIESFDEEYEGIFRIMQLQMRRGYMKGEPPWGSRAPGGKSRGEIRRNEIFIAHRERLIDIFSREEHDCTSKKRQLLVKLMKSLSSSAASSSSGASSSSYSANMVVVDLSEVATRMVSSLASSIVHQVVDHQNLQSFHKNVCPPIQAAPVVTCPESRSFAQGLISGLVLGLGGLGLFTYVTTPRAEEVREMGTMSQVTYTGDRFKWRGNRAETVDIGPTSISPLPRSYLQRFRDAICRRRRVIAR